MDLNWYFKSVQFGEEKKFTKQELPNLPIGFKPTLLGEPKLGMIGQYRCGLLHAREYPTYWMIHKDRYNPETHPIEHLVNDAPHWGAILGLGIIAGTVILFDWLNDDSA